MGIFFKWFNRNKTQADIATRRKSLLNLRQNTFVIGTESIEHYIIDWANKSKRGTIFFTEYFLNFGSAKAVGKALERLVNKGKISRIARGLYAILETHNVFGEIQPTTDEIAKTIARRDKARIIPTGSLALNVLGLSTQIPLNAVYLTDGSSSTITVGNRTIKLKKASPKNLASIGEISGLVIQALKELGKDKITEVEKKIILKHLMKEEPARLEHDIRLAPEWIRWLQYNATCYNKTASIDRLGYKNIKS